MFRLAVCMCMCPQVWDTVSPRLTGDALEWLRANVKPLTGAGAAAGGAAAAGGSESAAAAAAAVLASPKAEKATAGASA